MSDNQSDAGVSLSPPHVRKEASVSAIDRITHELREQILSGELEAGETMPTEQALSTRMSVGRSSVREALRILEAQGLIESVGRPLSRVVSRTGPITPLRENLDALLRLKRVTFGDLHSMRLALEVVAVRAAAVRPDPRCFDKMNEALAIMRRSRGDGHAFDVGDTLFHVGIVEASENELVQVLMSAVAGSTDGFVSEARHSKHVLSPRELDANHAELVAVHQAILDAVVERDRDRASLLVIENIESSYEIPAS